MEEILWSDWSDSETAASAVSELSAQAAQAVQEYLRLSAPPDVVHDPWSRVMDGLLVRVHVSRWSGQVSLSAEELGLDADTFRVVRERIRWGWLSLLPAEGQRFGALETRLRRLPERWGVALHWGRFVPTAAWPSFRAEWEALASEWRQQVAHWEARYHPAYAEVLAAVRSFARAAGAHAARVQQKALPRAWTETLVARIMEGYPQPGAIHQRFAISYETALIPRPTLLLEEAQRLEEMHARERLRRDALRRAAQLAELRDESERRALELQIDDLEARLQARQAVINEEVSRMRSEARARAQRLVAEFEATYARQIRERLWESLRHLLAALRGGRVNAMATRSLRTTIEELRRIAMADDAEISAMLDRLDAAMGPSGVRRRTRGAANPAPAELEQIITDIGFLLQTSIVALGGTPRRAGDSPLPLELADEDAPLGVAVRRAARRIGLDASSLTELLVEHTGLTRAGLRRAAADARS